MTPPSPVGTALAILLSLFALPAFTSALDIEVTDAGDTGPGTLRAAIATADGSTGDDTITFARGLDSATIELATPLVLSDTDGSTTIDATDPFVSISISGEFLTRVFIMNANTTNTLRGLKIVNGKAPDGTDGADADAPGDGNPGGDGGAIRNSGTSLRIQRCTFDGNFAGNGGKGGTNTGVAVDAGATGGNGGRGGAIANLSGELIVIDSLFEFNSSGTGGSGGDAESMTPGLPGNGGRGGDGGAIFDNGSGTTLVRSVFTDNFAGIGGLGGLVGSSGEGGTGGDGGDGGAFRCSSGTLTITDTRFGYNLAGDGGYGGEDSGSNDDVGGAGGSGGNGGAVSVSDFAASLGAPHVTGSLFFFNAAGHGAWGGNTSTNATNQSGTDAGSGGLGGGLFVHGSAINGNDFEISNSTFSSNTAGNGGSGGNGDGTGTGGSGADAGSGGAIHLTSAVSQYNVLLEHVTITGNAAGSPGNPGTPSGATAGLSGSGGGIFEKSGGISPGGGLTLSNSVVAANIASTNPNVGTFQPLGNNFTSGNPILGPLESNGGQTATHVPQAGSPLIDAGVAGPQLPLTDQRGKSRPFNNLPDIGAVEVHLQPDLRIGGKSRTSSHRLNNSYTSSGGKPEAVKLKGTRTKKFFVSLQNDGDIADQLNLRSNRPNRTLKVSVFKLTGGRKNITSAIARGGFNNNLEVGAIINHQVKVSAARKKRKGRGTLKYSARSNGGSVAPDAVKAKPKSRK